MTELKSKDYREIKKELDNCQNPLYLFHDDPDGLCSFLLLYKYKREGNGVIVKSTPKIDLKYMRKVEEYNPDKIFVLDIADVTQEFIDKVGVPIIWIDHHGPYERNNIKYFNPRTYEKNSNPPVSYLTYKVVKDYEWIALTGMVSDWYLPPDKERKTLVKKYPELLPEHIDRPEEALFSTELGRLCRIFSFILKGNHKDAIKYVKVLSRIGTPQEILKSETPQGKYIYRKFEKIEKVYQELLKEAKKKAGKSKFIVFDYSEDTTSYTSDLANELLYKFPEKIIVIARKKSNEMKCSLRAAKYDLPPMIEESIVGLEGAYGGGHEHAAGAVVKEEDFRIFLERMKKKA